MGLYKLNGIPWEGKSAVVPMKAVEDMRKLNHNWNWIPLEDIERTCRMEPTFTTPVSLSDVQEWNCSKCDDFTYTDGEDRPMFCAMCGAKVVG